VGDCRAEHASADTSCGARCGRPATGAHRKRKDNPFPAGPVPLSHLDGRRVPAINSRSRCVSPRGEGTVTIGGSVRSADSRHHDHRKVSSSSSSTSSSSRCERGLRRRLTGIAVVGLLAFSACSPANAPGDQPAGDASSADSTSSGDDSSTGGVDAGSGGSGAADTDRKTYKIGWQGPLSGDNQEVGTHEANGARLLSSRPMPRTSASPSNWSRPMTWVSPTKLPPPPPG
jgi:hypothetical protein